MRSRVRRSPRWMKTARCHGCPRLSEVLGRAGWRWMKAMTVERTVLIGRLQASVCGLEKGLGGSH
jgi:hypothetical protein